jgi:hypothetical protein
MATESPNRPQPDEKLGLLLGAARARHSLHSYAFS